MSINQSQQLMRPENERTLSDWEREALNRSREAELSNTRSNPAIMRDLAEIKGLLAQILVKIGGMT